MQSHLTNIPEQSEWLAAQQSPVQINPCVRAYGKGPVGATCKDCTHFYVHQCSHRFYKCDLRKHTNGPGSDHKKKWDACAKYERAPAPENQ